jgi:hypothetical protein
LSSIIPERKELGVESKGMLIVPTKNKYGFATNKMFSSSSITPLMKSYITQQHFKFPYGFIQFVNDNNGYDYAITFNNNEIGPPIVGNFGIFQPRLA